MISIDGVMVDAALLTPRRLDVYGFENVATLQKLCKTNAVLNIGGEPYQLVRVVASNYSTSTGHTCLFEVQKV